LTPAFDLEAADTARKSVSGTSSLCSDEHPSARQAMPEARSVPGTDFRAGIGRFQMRTQASTIASRGQLSLGNPARFIIRKRVARVDDNGLVSFESCKDFDLRPKVTPRRNGD